MQIFKSKHNSTNFYQIYLTKEEFEDEKIQERIENIKKSGARVALFISGNTEYIKIIERIIMLEVEEVNAL